MSRFYFASLGAVGLHAVLLLVRMPPASVSAPSPPSTAEQLIELEAEPQPSPQPALLVRDAELPRSAEHTPREATAVRVPSHALHAETASAEPAPAPTESAAHGASSLEALGPRAKDRGDSAPERKVDLGLDGRFFMRPPAEDLPRAQRSQFQRQLETSLSAADVQRGLARGNALLSSLSAAVRAAGPTRGEALVRVTVGADGAVSEVQLVQGNESEWSSVLRSFRELVTRKHVRIPPGARGLRVTFNVRAKVQRLSGSAVDLPPVNVAAPSLSPNGLTPHGDFDLTDLAGGAQRLVYARVAAEEVL